LENKLKEMENICHETKLEMFFLRKESDKTIAQLNTNLKFEKSSTTLEDIINMKSYIE
jgi:hypothetical protein